MAAKTYDLITIDDALVDEFYYADDAHLAAFGLTKAHTGFTDDPAFVQQVVQGLTPLKRMSGGASANSLVAVHQLGGKVGFSGKLGQGDLAEFYRQDLELLGIDVAPLKSDERYATGRCIVLVNPRDGERTMLTLLPQKISFSADDLPTPMLQNAQMLFTQAYRWNDDSKAAFQRSFALIREAGGKVAFSLSAPFCVEQYREEFQQMIDGGIDVLFANREEIETLYPGMAFEAICDYLAALSERRGSTIAITCGAEGSRIIHRGTVHAIAPIPVAQVVDACGAGDAYAGGVLFGLVRGLPIETCGALGGMLASKVIGRIGARVEADDYPPSASITAPHITLQRAANERLPN